RPRHAQRTRAAVQLRHGAEISAAAGAQYARPAQADRFREFIESEKPQRLTAGAGLKARLVTAVRNIDDVHRAVALAGDEQLVAVERHVHRLAADLDRGLLAK